jgi:hypothetical protein
MRRQALPEALAALRAPAGSRRPWIDDAAPAHLNALRVGHAVERTLAPLPTDSRCLIRSLVTTRVLARRGIESSLVIGVQPGEQLKAHAWVEQEGEPVLPAGDYRRLTEL